MILLETPDHFDWQGHRGCRGLLPENSIPGFIRAIELGVTTLEMDLVVSADQKLVVSHEPWMSHKICTDPSGHRVDKKAEKQFNIYQMQVAGIRQFDCGISGHQDFPEQQPLHVYKPTFAEVIDAVRAFCNASGRSLPALNIELKSRQSWYGQYVPQPEAFVKLAIREIEKAGILPLATVQSFDLEILKALKAQDFKGRISLLNDGRRSLRQLLDTLGFTPDVYSPNHTFLTKKSVVLAHRQGMRVIPWTVNTIQAANRMIDMGVDGIITDYPDRFLDGSE